MAGCQRLAFKDIHNFIMSLVGEDLHAKRVYSLANATQGIITSCVYRKLDSAILVVKSTENWVWRDGTEALNRAVERRVLVQGTMSPRLIIVGGIGA
jgi:hypothetical protein